MRGHGPKPCLYLASNHHKKNPWGAVIMKKTFLTVALASALGLGVVGATVGAAPVAYKAPKGPGGHPDLNGVWRVGNSANWDIEPHAAKPAIQMRDGPVVPVPAKAVVALGAIGAVPAGMGVVLD